LHIVVSAYFRTIQAHVELESVNIIKMVVVLYDVIRFTNNINTKGKCFIHRRC